MLSDAEFDVHGDVGPQPDAARADAALPDAAVPDAPTCTLSADPATVAFGGSTTLRWSVEGDSATLRLLEDTVVEAEGALVVGSLADDLWVELSSGELRCQIVIEVERPSDVWILGAGQSNMGRHFGGPSPTSADRLEAGVLALEGVATSTFVNAAVGGTALRRVNAQPDAPYWVDDSAAELMAGPLLTRALNRVRARVLDGDVTMILWAQGERDASAIAGRLTSIPVEDRADALAMEAALYRRALRYLFEQLRAETGMLNTPMGIQGLGRLSGRAGRQYAVHDIRLAQAQVAEDMPSVRVLAETYDASLADSVHLDDTWKNVVVDRLVESIERWRLRQPVQLGPEVTEVARDDDELIVSLSRRGAVELGPESATLFSFFDASGVWLGPASSIEVAGDQFRLRAPAGATEMATAFGSLDGYVNAPIVGSSLESLGVFVHDGTGRPLRSSRHLLP